MRNMKKTFRIGVLATVFAAGYLSGSVTQRGADAQGLKEMGEGAMKGAAKSQGVADDSAAGTSSEIFTSGPAALATRLASWVATPLS